MKPWSERNPNPRSNVLREDGRVCFYVKRAGIIVSQRTKRTKLVLLMACGDQVTPRTMPGLVLFPVTTPDALTCPGCIMVKDAERGPPRAIYNPAG